VFKFLDPKYVVVENQIVKMLLTIQGLLLTTLVFCILLSVVEAGKLSDISRQKGYNAKLRKRSDHIVKPKAQPVVKRASTTSSICTTAIAPSPTLQLVYIIDHCALLY
jgi:hypothetical protein